LLACLTRDRSDGGGDRHQPPDLVRAERDPRDLPVEQLLFVEAEVEPPQVASIVWRSSSRSSSDRSQACPRCPAWTMPAVASTGEVGLGNPHLAKCITLG
jgi:hypothetical protein